MAEGDDVKGGAAAGAGTGTAGAGNGAQPAGAPAAGGGTAAATAEAAGAAAADAEALRVSTLTPEEKAAEESAKADAPADYSILKMPEGYTTDPKDPVFGEALKIFGDNKITPDVAQKLLDFTTERDKTLAKAINDQNSQLWNKQASEWKTATEKEFSPADLGGAKTALVQVFSREFVGYLDALKLTNNPEFVRGMVKISKAIAEDHFVTGNAANGAARTAQQMFPNSKMNP